MKLADLIRSGGLRKQAVATVTLATVATHAPRRPPTVASVATVSVANARNPANDAPADRLARAEHALRTFAERCGIPWPSARAYLTDADVVAGADCLELAERLQDPAELRMVQGWLSSLDGVPWKG